MSITYADEVGAYAEHLRTGGTTPWMVWTAGDRAPVDARRDPTPSSVHLELVRRMNEEATQPLPGLADLVFATPAPGRGRVDVPVPWAPVGRGESTDPHRFGSPPIDPAHLPKEELVRLAVGVLTRVLPRVPPPPAHPELTRWPVAWRRRFRLHGSPGTVAQVRAGLLSRGLVETDWRPVHLVLARPLEVMMAEHWAAATANGAHPRWATVWRRAVAADALPRGLDVVGIAERLAGSSARRREQVHLVIARTPSEAAAAAAQVVRARPFEAGRDPDAAQVDLLRRLNRQAAITSGVAQVRRLSRSLTGVLEETSPHAPSTAPPRSAATWARHSAESAARRAREAGYAVHGDPETLIPVESGGADHSGAKPGAVDPRHTLAVAVEACVRAWSRQEESS